jgi:integrative and conjugative element protein (TIGR02256 family)
MFLPCETGGFLMGLRRGQHFEITGATYPGAKDVSTPYSFSRLDEHHAQDIHDAWKSNESFVTLIGDWHSHPTGSGSPSSKDRRAWRSLLSNGLVDCIGIILGDMPVPRFFYICHGYTGTKKIEWSLRAHDENDLVLYIQI